MYSSKDVQSLVVFVDRLVSLGTKHQVRIHVYEENEVHSESQCDCQGSDSC